MSALSLRRAARTYASHLTREQRRRWMAQRLVLTPKVAISSGWVPFAIARQYAYTSPGATK